MTEIYIEAKSTEGVVREIQKAIGGSIEERWGESILTVNNSLAIGTIRYITFDWGVNLLEYEIRFSDDIVLIMDASEYNPIHFTYCFEGYCRHRFGYQAEDAIETLEQFQSVIITSREGGYNYGYFPKDIALGINVIQVRRKLFLKKRLNNMEELNKTLYRVFLDSDHERAYAFYGAYNLKLADKIMALRKIKTKGMIRIMQMEGMVYQILSMHILEHDKAIKNSKPPTSLLKSELKTVRQIARKIINNPSEEYSLESLSRQAGLSQYKLQEGFKLLYTRTVTEYIRHTRLEAARDYIRNSDMNISQIVYSIGFSSRSYFSKIFKKKYGLSPSEFQNNVQNAAEITSDNS